jgi:transposase
VIQIAAGTKVYLACRPVDMRRGFDGLSAEVVNTLNVDPYSGHLFLFRGKRGGYLKALYWDGTGMCLFAKRLEHGKVVWPSMVFCRCRQPNLLSSWKGWTGGERGCLTLCRSRRWRINALFLRLKTVAG